MGVGKASLKVERLCALPDPRWKALGADQLVNSSAALRTRAEKGLKGVIAGFEDAQTQPSAPAPVLGVEPVYVYMVIIYSEGMDQPRKVANPARGQLGEQGKIIFPCPRSRLRIWFRKMGSAVPSRVSLLSPYSG